MSSEPNLRPEHVALLAWMAETAERLGNNEFLFVQFNGPTGLYVNDGPPRAHREGPRGTAEVLVRSGLVDSRINSKGNPEYWVLPDGHSYFERHLLPVGKATKIRRWLDQRRRQLLTVGVLSLIVAVLALIVDLLNP